MVVDAVAVLERLNERVPNLLEDSTSGHEFGGHAHFGLEKVPGDLFLAVPDHLEPSSNDLEPVPGDLKALPGHPEPAIALPELISHLGENLQDWADLLGHS